MIHWSDFIYTPLYELASLSIEILIALAMVALVIWLLIIERYLYFAFNYKHLRAQYLQRWQQTYNEAIATRRLLKFYYLSECRLHGERNIEWIHQLSKVSLLLGLLGTVTGLISVFELQLLAVSDASHQISSAISRTIIPTASGLLISLTGLFCTYHLKNIIRNSISRLDYLLN